MEQDALQTHRRTMPCERGRRCPVTRLPPALGRLRHAIDATDDALVLAVALRRALVGRIGAIKHAQGLPMADPAREHAVRLRARRLGARLGVPRATVDAVLEAAIADARRAQGLAPDVDQGGRPVAEAMIAADMHSPPAPHRWLRFVPPPARLAPLVGRVPLRWQGRLLERAIAAALAAPLAAGMLDFMRDRRLGIEVDDLGLRWTLALHDGRVVVVEEIPEASVRGSAADLLLMAARLEDADTLFFQRRLVLTGDTELGLTARNVLDRLPWEDVPLALRVLLHRAAGLARDAREAHRAAH